MVRITEVDAELAQMDARNKLEQRIKQTFNASGLRVDSSLSAVMINDDGTAEVTLDQSIKGYGIESFVSLAESGIGSDFRIDASYDANLIVHFNIKDLM